ncbi:MAG: hypothetical protein NTW59_00010, partial [Candidatus Diapherotrites archaeon]|nr:hypothetical protein [Candidatus Diapherotrites archaeon]
TVEISNPRVGFSYPPQIALWLARAATEDRAYAQSPLQMVNTGAVPITAFRTTLDIQAYQSGVQAGFMPSSIDYITIPAGQAVTPQRFVYAQTTAADAFKQPVQGSIHYTGVIAGQQYPDLGNTRLNLNYTGIKCLKASPATEGVEILTFSSKTISGTLENDIKIKNECGEPVILFGKVLPETRKNNRLAYSPNVTLLSGQEVAGKLLLMKGGEDEWKMKVRLVGILQMQNKAIESNDLDVAIKIGQAATAQSVDPATATKKISLKKCDTEGDFRQFQFPVVSTGDCSKGYCDAKQLADYIIKKADALVNSAKDKASRANRQAWQFGECGAAGSNHCSFEDMGVPGKIEPAYLMVDNMNTELLQHELEAQSKTELKSYSVVQAEKKIDSISDIGFEFGQVYLAGNMTGCGLYRFAILGAASVKNGEILNAEEGRNYMLVINVTQERATTEQCLHKIENAANFLPLDEGFDISNFESYYAWPGIVEAKGDLKDLGKELANAWFKKSEGRFGETVPSGTNRLVVVKGDTSKGIVKIKINNNEGTSPDSPKTVYAIVPEEFAVVKSDIASALVAFKGTTFNRDKDCWGEDADGEYIVMRSYEKIGELYGQLSLDGAKSVKINTQEQCVDLNVTSKAAERIKLATNFLESGDSAKKPKTGIEYIAVYNKNKNGEKGKMVLKESANGVVDSKGNDIELKKPGEEPAGGNARAGGNAPTGAAGSAGAAAGTGAAAQPAGGSAGTSAPAGTGAAAQPAAGGAATAGNKYRVDLLFCVKGDAQFALAAENTREIEVTAISLSDFALDRKSRPFPIKIEACGIHPYDLVKKMAAVTVEEIDKAPNKQVVAYATVGWKGSPETVSMITAQRALAAELARQGAYGTGPGVETASQPEYMVEIAKRRAWATLGYFVPCAATALALNWWTFGIKGGWDITLNCAMPAVWNLKNIAKEAGGGWKTLGDGVDDTIRTVLSFIPLVGNWLGEAIVPAADATNSTLTQQQLEEKGASFGQILPAALTGMTVNELTASITNANDIITVASAQRASEEGADILIKGWIKNGTLQGSTQEQLDFLLHGHYDAGKWVKASRSAKVGPTPLRATLIDKMNTNLLANQGKSLGANFTPSAVKAADDIAEPMLETLAKAADSGMLPRPLTRAWNVRTQSYLNTIVNPTEVSGFNPATTSLPPTTDPSAVTQFRASIATKWQGDAANFVRSQLMSTDDG